MHFTINWQKDQSSSLLREKCTVHGTQENPLHRAAFQLDGLSGRDFLFFVSSPDDDGLLVGSVSDTFNVFPF